MIPEWRSRIDRARWQPRSDEPPAHREARAYKNAGGMPCCSACERRIADVHQHRCPYTDCAAWLIGSEDPQPDRRKREEEA